MQVYYLVPWQNDSAAYSEKDSSLMEHPVRSKIRIKVLRLKHVGVWLPTRPTEAEKRRVFLDS